MANTNSRSYPKGLREIRYPSNDMILRFTSKDYTGTLKLNNETGLFEFDPALEGTGGSSAGTSFAITQVAHGFSALQPLYHDGTGFKLANASAEDTLGQWVVIQVTGPDNFTAAQSGRFEVSHVLTPGQFYFVGETDGSITPTEPTTYSNPVIFVESTTHIHILPFRPSTPSGGSGGGSGDVQSVFGRTGVVVAESGDYTKDQVGLGNVLNVEQIPTTEKASANGVATLDGSGKIPAEQIPVALQGGIDIIGFWDADLNLPNIGALALNQGEAYQVSEAGNTNLNGITDWQVGDLAIWGDTVVGNWFKIENSNTVQSVNGQTGAVVLDTDNISEGVNKYYTEARVSANSSVAANTNKVSANGSINTHSDVDISTVSPVTGQPLVWNGSKFIPAYIQGVLPSGIQGDVLYHNGADWVPLNAGTAGYVLSTNGAGANPSWIEGGGGASERENVSTTVSLDAQTTTVDFNDVQVETLSIDDGGSQNTITTHTIAVSNLSTTERYNTLVIDNSLNTLGLNVTLDDQTGAITYRSAKNDFPGTYPIMNVAAGAIWEVNFENRSATLVTVGFDEMEEN